MVRIDPLIIKNHDMQKVAEYRENLRENPRLVWLFLEVTQRCNLFCLHCGSLCSPKAAISIDYEAIGRVLTQVADQYGARNVMIAITGGEPLLYEHFFELASLIRDLGFRWGITSNGTMITQNCGERLCKLGLGSASISIDGLEDTHDWLRNCKGAYTKALRGVKNLIETNPQAKLQVTTVVYKHNMGQIEQLGGIIERLGVGSWRLVNIEPIGRALEYQELMLNSADFEWLMDFIQRKRFDTRSEMVVTYGCSHFLGLKRERMVRDNYFLCGAGIFVASISANGDILACLDIERSSKLVQGNIYKDDFIKVWTQRFDDFRKDRCSSSEVCRNCPNTLYCAGDSAHTWDFENSIPRFCLRNTINY